MARVNRITIEDTCELDYALLDEHMQQMGVRYTVAAKRSDIRNALLRAMRDRVGQGAIRAAIRWYNVDTRGFVVRWDNSNTQWRAGVLAISYGGDSYSNESTLRISIGCRKFIGEYAFTLMVWALGKPLKRKAK